MGGGGGGKYYLTIQITCLLYDAHGPKAVRVDPLSKFQHNLVGRVLACGDNRQENAARLLHVRVDKFFTDLHVVFSLLLVWAVNQARKVHKGEMQ